jgi:hypothetical protein
MACLLGFFKSRVGILLLLLLPMSLVFSQIGGPYTVDANTVVLMHFDGNLNNESTLTAAGEFHGDASNFFFLANQVPNLNQCLRIDNDSQVDSAFITVADDDDLDMIGDWTIEGWINIFTFGTGSSDWRWVPRLAIKTGDVNFWQPNFFVEMWGDNRLFSCGYHTASQDQWPQANTPSNIMDVGTWYHMAFIRDTTTHLLMTIIHKFNTSTNQIELVSFTASDYLSFGAADPTPIITAQPLHIGYAGGGGDSFLDGFVDEIRISNVVREFPVPPIISGVSVLSNQATSVPQYEIGAHIFTVNSGSTIQSANLFYSTDAGANWTSVAMTTVSGDSMVAAIPQQPLGSIIRYYLEATDNNGLSFQFPQDAGWLAAEFYSFGVYQPNTLVLNLTFEEGSGVPADQSDYHNPITPYGNPTYSTDAAAGNYSIYFDQVDSTMLESDSPFLAAKEYFVDFWAKPDPIMLDPANNYCRIINRPGAANNHADNNYQVRFNPGGYPYGATDGSFNITLDYPLAMDRWYHFQLEARMAPPGDTVAYYAIFRVEDTNGLHVQQKYIGFDAPVRERWAPLRIGKANLWTTSYPPFYKGYYDNIMIYNYAAGNLSLENITSIDGEDATIPVEYALYQNYPNPFNPVTDIRFNIAKSGKVSLVIYDLLGHKVRTLINSNLSYGKHWVQWDGTADNGYPVASGVYFYRLEAKDFSQTMKMVLMK